MGVGDGAQFVQAHPGSVRQRDRRGAQALDIVGGGQHAHGLRGTANRGFAPRQVALNLFQPGVHVIRA